MPTRPSKSSSLVLVFLTATLLTALSLELGSQGLSTEQDPQLVDAEGDDLAGITHQLTKEVRLRGKEASKTPEEMELDRGISLVAGEVPTDEDLDDVKYTTEAAEEALTEVEATTEVLDVTLTDEALNDVKPTAYASDVFPTEEPLDDSTPTDEVLVDVIITDEESMAETLSEGVVDDGASSMDKQYKLVRNDDSLATSLLMDIRDALNSEREGQEEQTLSNSVEQRLDALASENEDSIGRISSNFERLRHNMDEKVSLVLETFSTLKVLVLSQGDHLRALQERLLRMESEAHNAEVQAQALRMSLNEIKSDLASHRTPAGGSSSYEDLEKGDPQVNNTKPAGGAEESRPSLTGLTSQVKKITDAVKSIKDELQVVQTDVTNLSLVTPHSSTIDNESRRGTQTAFDDSTACLCPTDQLKSSIVKLEASQQRQRSEMDELARNLTLLDVPQEASNGSWLFGHRLGEVEGTLTDLSAMQTEVNAVREDLHLLKEEMGKKATQAIANATATASSAQGMCVWPYKRGGGGCFHVHTEDRLSWQAAREHCRVLQGDLASPLNYNQFKLFILKQRLSRAYTYWLGASDAGLEGEWIWTDGRPVNKDTWETSTPDPRSAKCMALKPVYKFVASAEACRESRFFICQQERQL